MMFEHFSLYFVNLLALNDDVRWLTDKTTFSSRVIVANSVSLNFIKNVDLKFQIIAIVCNKFRMMFIWRISCVISAISMMDRMQHSSQKSFNISKAQMQVSTSVFSISRESANFYIKL